MGGWFSFGRKEEIAALNEQIRQAVRVAGLLNEQLTKNTSVRLSAVSELVGFVFSSLSNQYSLVAI